jgi:7SK snRNA methylphosphate capping enzyme
MADDAPPPDAAAAAAAGTAPLEAPQAQPSAAPAARGRKARPCFRYGNYPGYYGYRVGIDMEDHRLLALRREWFAGRRCLDVGCNEGLVSLTLAVKFGTAAFEGVDIDGALVHGAQAKLRRLQRAAAEAAADVAAAAPGEQVPAERAALAAAAPALAATRYRHARGGRQARWRRALGHAVCACVPPARARSRAPAPPDPSPGAATSWTSLFRRRA